MVAGAAGLSRALKAAAAPGGVGMVAVGDRPS